jgi:hypothetical protein
MKKRIIVIIILFSLINDSYAQDYKTALGVRLSSSGPLVNNSISLKHFIGTSIAVEGLLSLSDPTAIGVLVEKHKPMGETALNWYYGAGAYVGFHNTSKFGGQAVLGIDYKFQNVPLNISIDWKPELNIISKIYFEPAALGFTARFTFGN